MSKASGCLAGRSRRRICDTMLRCILPRRVVRAAHGTGPRARRMQDIESGKGYDTRRRALAGTFAHLSQTTGYATVRLPTCF